MGFFDDAFDIQTTTNVVSCTGTSFNFMALFLFVLVSVFLMALVYAFVCSTGIFGSILDTIANELNELPSPFDDQDRTCYARYYP